MTTTLENVDFTPSPFDPEKKDKKKTGKRVGAALAGLAVAGGVFLGLKAAGGGGNPEGGPEVPTTSAPSNPGETTKEVLPSPDAETIIIPLSDGTEVTGLQAFADAHAVTTDKYPATPYDGDLLSAPSYPTGEIAAATEIFGDLGDYANAGKDEKTQERYSDYDISGLLKEAVDKSLFAIDHDQSDPRSNQLGPFLDEARSSKSESTFEMLGNVQLMSHNHEQIIVFAEFTYTSGQVRKTVKITAEIVTAYGGHRLGHTWVETVG